MPSSEDAGTIPSLPTNSSPSSSFSGLGRHGNSSPVGSSETAALPSVVMVEPSSSTMTRDGMPDTLNFLESASFADRAS